MPLIKSNLMNLGRSRPKLRKFLILIIALCSANSWMTLKPLYGACAYFSTKKKLNVGSGRRRWPGWICLDEIEDIGVTKFSFTETSRFPIENDSMEIVYSSHFLEHISDASVDQVLSEAWRCLQPKGQLILKIPDFDMFVEKYLENEYSSFSDIGVDSVLHTWNKHGIEDNIANRFAMMFCGYMNVEYGAHFTEQLKQGTNGAFHGPPKVSEEELAFIVESNVNSPHRIAESLREIAIKEQQVHCWNHQNAWSQKELETILQSHGFLVSTLSASNRKVLKRKIPDFENMRGFSMYLLATKPENRMTDLG